MSAYGNASTHVNNDQVQGVVRNAFFIGITLCNRFLVQRVEDAGPGKFGNAGISRDRHKLIYDYGIYDIRRCADGIPDFFCKDAAQIRSMLSLDAHFQIFQQIVRNGISASCHGFEHAAASDDDIEGVHIEIFFLHQIQNNVFPEIFLVYDRSIPGDLFRRVS